jgi:hypothetical protein
LKQAVTLAGDALNWFVDIGKKAVSAFIGLAEIGGKVQDVSVGFAKNFEDTTDALNALREASKGTISDFDLMLSANKAAMLGVTTDSGKLAKLLEVARGRGQAMGLDTTQAFSDIVTGIGRMSPFILDNLGITTAAYKNQVAVAESLGIVIDDATKREMLLSTVLEGNVGPAVETATSSLERFKAWWTNLRNELALAVAPVFQEIAEYLLPNIQMAVENVKSAIATWWNENKEIIMPKVYELKDALDVLWGKIAALSDPTSTTSQKFEELASKLTEDFIDNLTEMATQIGNILTWLMSEEGQEALGTFIEDVKQISKDVSGAVKWLTEMSTQIQGIIVGLQTLDYWTRQISSYGLYGAISGKKNPQTEWEKKMLGESQSGGLSGGLTLVGETGPELVSLPHGSQVYSSEQTKLMGDSGGIVVNFNGDLMLDSESRIDQLVEKIELALGNNTNLGLRGV